MDNLQPAPSMEPPVKSSFSFKQFFKNRKVVLTLVLAVLMLGYGVWAYNGFSVNLSTFFAAEDCGFSDFDVSTVNRDGQATVDLKQGVPVPCKVYLASYKRMENDTLPNQELFATAELRLDDRQPHTFTVAVPDCHYQIDLSNVFIENAQDYRTDNLLDATFSDGSQGLFYCDQETHLECVSNACTEVLGGGSNDDACTGLYEGNACTTTTSLSCAPATQNVNTGSAASMTASGGSGTYSWSAPGGTPTTGTGGSFSSSYATTGTKTVTVTSGAETATCQVVVATAPTALSCAPATQHVDIGVDVSLTASGGTGTYSWTASGGTPATGAGESFDTRYSTAGTKTVRVTSGSETATCQVIVDVPPTPLSCAPSTQTRDIGVNATLTASGGTGTYSWATTNGFPSSTGTGGSFSVYYATLGTKTVTVTSGAETATCQVVVATNPLTCAPASVNIGVNQNQTFTSTGGDPTQQRSWLALEGVPTTGGNSASFATKFATAGTKTITVTRGSETATCQAIVTAPPTVLTCAPASVNLTTGQNQTFTTTGGTGIRSWSAPGGSPAGGGGDIASFTTQYSTAGTKIVTITRGTETATCQAIVTAPPAAVQCSPNTQNRFTDEVAIINAAGGNGTFSWSAPSGNPNTGSGSSFGVSYANPGTYNAVVTSNGESATCQVVVSTRPAGLVCLPSNQSAFVDQTTNFNATGGTGSYVWSAPGSVIPSGSGSGFSTRYSSAGSYNVTVTSGTESRICAVSITAPTPTPTPVPSPGLGIVKTVRNVTASSAEVDVVSANPTDTVEFSIRVTAYGTTTVRNARVTDVLPQGLSYVAGSTSVDGVTASDGIITGGVTLGDINPGRTILIRFRALVASATAFSTGTTTLTNVATATSDNTPTVSDPAFVNVTKSQGVVVSLEKYGRNITRGEFGELNHVTAYPQDTIEFIIRVRSLSPTRLDNLILRDILPAVITYIPNTTSIDGAAAGEGLITGGLNIGSLEPGQQKTIRFSGRVAAANALPAGTTSVINTAQLIEPPLIAQLPITIINGIIGGVVIVPTGTEESVFTALLISLVITMMYVAYTRTSLFRTREVKSIMKKDKGEDTFDFKG